MDAQRTNGGRQYQITTKNLTRLTLRETSKAGTIQIDGQNLKVKSAPEIVLEKTGAGWKPSGPLYPESGFPCNPNEVPTGP